MVKVMEDLVGVGVAGGLGRPALAYDWLENRLTESDRVEFRSWGYGGLENRQGPLHRLIPVNLIRSRLVYRIPFSIIF